jgi:hypothetical protein
MVMGNGVFSGAVANWMRSIFTSLTARFVRFASGAATDNVSGRGVATPETPSEKALEDFWVLICAET